MRKFSLLAGLFFFAIFAKAQTNNLPDLELELFATGFQQPVGLEHAGDSRLFVVEQTGKIKIIGESINPNSPFLNLSDKINTQGFEQGLLGLAFDPNYEENGYFYVHYTNLDRNSRFSRFRVNPNNPNKALPSSEVILFENDDPFSNHNGGQLKFGPDGYLYATIGDGGSGGDPFNNAQDLSTTFGKLLRIDVTDPANGTYTIPPDNPYANMAGAAGEIWASGLRNPWRFSFDYLTGDLWIPDVGQNNWEEVNFTPASSAGGVNYGWSCMEATHFFKADCDDNGVPFTAPIAEYAHDNNPDLPCSGSITGGYVYRGAHYPDMYGKYFYTDFCTGVIRTTYWDGSEWVTADLGNFTPFAYSTFGEDMDADLYLVDKTAGNIYLVTDGGASAYSVIDDQLPVSNFQQVAIDPSLAQGEDIDMDELIRESVHRMPAISIASPVITNIAIYPNPNNGPFTIEMEAGQPQQYEITILDLMGREMLHEKQEGSKGFNQWEFNSSSFTEGVYTMRIQSVNEMTTVKFVVD